MKRVIAFMVRLPLLSGCISMMMSMMKKKMKNMSAEEKKRNDDENDGQSGIQFLHGNYGK